MRNRSRLFVGLMAMAMVVGLLFQEGDVSAASLKSQLDLKLHATLTNLLDLTTEGTVDAKVFQQILLEFSNGTGANQANVVWGDRRTISASTTEDLDFIGGGLLDAFGGTVAPAKLRLVLIAADSANAQNLTLFGDANSIPILNTAATTYTLQPKGLFLGAWPAVAGIPVTAGTGDIIQVANGAGVAVTYIIVFLGTTV